MNAEVFATWLRRQGHEVVRTPSSYWYEASPRVLQAFPFHWVIRPDEHELTRLLRSTRAIALRYSTPLDAPAGCVSYHVVCDDRGYGLEKLERRSRQNVRAGLARCTVEPIPVARLAAEGWALERDTAERQGRATPLTERTWRERYLAAADLPGFEAWGALVDGRLAASVLALRVEDCCELISQQALGEFAAARVNNALAYVVTQSLMQRPGVRSIFYTLQSLDAPPSVDEFKVRMGYAAKPLRQRVVFHPWAERAVGPLAHALVRRLRRRDPGSYLLAKADGMLRFHLQGKRAAADQDWPELLAAHRACAAAAPYPRDPGGARTP